jgi:hypothetical protein
LNGPSDAFFSGRDCSLNWDGRFIFYTVALTESRRAVRVIILDIGVSRSCWTVKPIKNIPPLDRTANCSPPGCFATLDGRNDPEPLRWQRPLKFQCLSPQLVKDRSGGS